jgi:hypothetical protein
MKIRGQLTRVNSKVTYAVRRRGIDQPAISRLENSRGFLTRLQRGVPMCQEERVIASYNHPQFGREVVRVLSMVREVSVGMGMFE